MTRDEIIKLAREAGFAINTRTGEINASHGSYNWIISRELERFAALVAAAEREACSNHYLGIMRGAIAEEREACAKVCTEIMDDFWTGDDRWETARHCAESIRARSQQ